MDILDRLSKGWTAWVLLLVITMGAAAPGVFSLPALDRDESRFAQASKQMLETGDYIRIRYQDELRNKKPAGIHWMQAGATALFSDAEAKQIWSYRLPSWIGAGLGTLATFWCGLALLSRRAAFMGAALFGSTLLLTSEAHISKTDGMLVFLTTLGIGALARLYMRADQDKRLALLFWGAMGLGFLIKGPVSIMVAAYAGFGVWVWGLAGERKGGDWWRVLIWWPGPALFLALWIPWFLWIQTATDGQYVQGAVGKDLRDKFAGASEGHAGWPLYHLSHIPVWFFPATLALIPGIMVAWNGLRGASQAARQRGTDALLILGSLAGVQAIVAWVFGAQTLVAYPVAVILAFWGLGLLDSWHDRFPQPGDAPALTDMQRALRFLVAWALLTTFFFELMPTRLSHYILPAYPALGLLCGLGLERMMSGAKMPVARWSSLVLFIIGAIALAATSIPGVDRLIMAEAAGDFATVDAATVMATWEGLLDYPLGLWIAGLVALALAIGTAIRGRHGMAVAASVAVATLFGWHVRAVFLPSQTWVQPTVVAQAALSDVCGLPGRGEGCLAPGRIQAVGYAEPSYVMTTGTQNLHPPETVVALPDTVEDYPAVFLVNLEDEAGPEALETLSNLARAAGACERRSPSHYGVNYSNGDPVHFIAIRFEAPGCQVAPPA